MMNDPITDDEKILMIDDMKLSAENEFTKPGGAVITIT